ncbi:MAG: hypothetical protein COA96_15780 [SAR86 cluster bacterium]|uniref:Uncharacterized protein n=1 Tax=SAR86 cluster bacterium TaxID=2030880 RepID=A0A2A5AMM8_9GAMM|nr:MAG: hypothetical protein COA96_15780 [SAR86 cluster bacterium]
MKFEKSPFEGISVPSTLNVIKAAFFGLLEITLASTFFLIYSETVDFGGAYLTTLPFGVIFESAAPDADVSSLICILLSLFSILVPLFIWSEAFEKVFDDPREYFSHPSNQVIASIALLLLLSVILIECVSLFSLLGQAIAPTTVFVSQESTGGVVGWLAKNQGYAVGISLGLALINLTLSFFSVRAFRNLNTQ